MTTNFYKLRIYLLAVIGLVLSVNCLGQSKQTEDVGQLWLAYFNQTRFSNKWGLWSEAPEDQGRHRRRLFPGNNQVGRYILCYKYYKTHRRLCLCSPLSE